MKSRWFLIAVILLAAFLRIYKVDKVPVSLFSDELDAGYQAYSIIKTGRDYMGNFLPLHFESYVEWRAPFYIYSAVPSVALFGLTAIGIRLPAIIFGVLGVWMMYLFVKELLIFAGQKNRSEVIAKVSAFIMTINPWHLQYSRAAFEASGLVFLILCGMYFFFKGLIKPRYIFLSAFFLGLAPWDYSTAKLFIPVFVVTLCVIFFKEIIKLPKTILTKSLIVFLVLGLPLFYVVIFGGGAQRFNKISVFGDPARESAISQAIFSDAVFLKENNGGIFLKLISKIVNNKISFWGAKILDNYFTSFSTNFLFLKGDISLRHSVNGIGQFYKFEAVLLLLGVILFTASKINRKVKLVILFWILFGVIPSAITIEGGAHATRLILILPPLIFLIAYGLTEIFQMLPRFWKPMLLISYIFLFTASFCFYQYNYWVRYPWTSEKQWHAGFGEAVSDIKSVEGKYDKVIITNAEELPYIFFAAYYKYDPKLWQKGFQVEYVPGFGELKHMGKFYFGQVDGQVGFGKLSDLINYKILYVASQREFAKDLSSDPQSVPKGFRLVDTINYPSGEPVFYLLENTET